jgi:ubiquinone/menaquinone biosynthesis C-methylase UbiE
MPRTGPFDRHAEEYEEWFAAPLGITIGVEPSSRMRKRAESRGIRVLEGVAESLPFPDACFDFALMVTTICFLDDAAKAFRETARVLRAGGVFVIGFVDKDSALGLIYQQRREQNRFYRQAIQTVFGQMEKIRCVQNYEKGHGQGGFVVIRARKKTDL